MAKRHWLRNGNIACPTKATSDARLYGITAERFVARSKADPDLFCTLCAKAARLALAAESAPKPSDVVWPKPRPIAEAPRTTILAWFPGTDMFNEGWEIVFPSDEGWITGREGHQPTHFLPLPPEVK